MIIASHSINHNDFSEVSKYITNNICAQSFNIFQKFNYFNIYPFSESYQISIDLESHKFYELGVLNTKNKLINKI